jgi:hypothetical protein
MASQSREERRQALVKRKQLENEAAEARRGQAPISLPFDDIERSRRAVLTGFERVLNGALQDGDWSAASGALDKLARIMGLEYQPIPWKTPAEAAAYYQGLADQAREMAARAATIVDADCGRQDGPTIDLQEGQATPMADGVVVVPGVNETEHG